MLGVVFFFSQFSPIEIIIFNKKFLNHFKDKKSSGGLKIAKFSRFWTKFCAIRRIS